jgi:hypothetical protein
MFAMAGSDLSTHDVDTAAWLNLLHGDRTRAATRSVGRLARQRTRSSAAASRPHVCGGEPENHKSSRSAGFGSASITFAEPAMRRFRHRYRQIQYHYFSRNRFPLDR